MKPSMFSTMAPQHGADSDRAQEAAFDRITRVVDYALKNEINVTLEAEDHRWTNFQLESYFALINAGYANLGTVLQTRLFRTEKDIARFDGRMRVRLVIGIYNEPGQIAHTDKRIMKDLLVQYGSNLLARGVYTELASHDTRCIETFYKKVVLPQSVPASQFEHQFLQGVPRTKLQNGLVTGNYFREPEHGFAASAHLEKLKETGALVRMYLPFGTAKVSGAYCKRRLRENPNMITYGVKNLLGLQ
jgi:proline dehydrogenase